MGIEPMTFCLQDRCSTTKLNRLLVLSFSFLSCATFSCEYSNVDMSPDDFLNKNVKGDYGDRTHDLLFTRQMLYH